VVVAVSPTEYTYLALAAEWLVRASGPVKGDVRPVSCGAGGRRGHARLGSVGECLTTPGPRTWWCPAEGSG